LIRVLSRDGGKHASAIKITSNTFKYIETRVIEMAKVNLRPLDDRVVVQPLEAEETTAGGIVLPDSAKEKPQRGKVVAVGPGKLLDNGVRAALSVSVGDEVIFGKYGGSEVEVDGVEYKILRESDVLAKLA
jgi:chaperonin GroES